MSNCRSSVVLSSDGRAKKRAHLAGHRNRRHHLLLGGSNSAADMITDAKSSANKVCGSDDMPSDGEAI